MHFHVLLVSFFDLFDFVNNMQANEFSFFGWNSFTQVKFPLTILGAKMHISFSVKVLLCMEEYFLSYFNHLLLLLLLISSHCNAQANAGLYVLLAKIQ